MSCVSQDRRTDSDQVMREMLPLAGGLVAVIVATLLMPTTRASTAITFGVPMLTGIAVYFSLKVWASARRNGK